MDQLKKLFDSLTLRQKITLAVAAVLVFGGLYAFSHWRREADFKPLYTSLAPEDAGVLVQKIKETGTEYRLSENGTSILVPSTRVADLRLEMAAAGLPRTGRIGFELFDKTNLGATEFAEHINYQRALEGELERSMMAMSGVEQARVHVTFPKDSVFLEAKQAAKASVMLKVHPGIRLTPQNVTAVTHLVSSAVEGLAPEGVSVLDMQGNLLSRPRLSVTDDQQPSQAAVEYRKTLENDILLKVNSALEPLLGANKFRAGVSVECDLSTSEQSEETLDPDKSVMLTSQKLEEGNSMSLAGGTPGTTSNLPRPPAKAAGGSSGLSRRTENIAYQTSRTVKHTKLPQGSIKRMSLAILLDQGVRWEGKGASLKKTLIPPAPETVKAIHDLVAGITGFVAERGDQLVIETLPFESTLAQEPDAILPPAAPPSGNALDKLPPVLKKPGVLIGVAAGVVLLVGGGVVLFFRRKKNKKIPAATQHVLVSSGGESPGQPALVTSADSTREMELALAEREVTQKRLDSETLASLKLAPVVSKKAEILTKHVRESFERDTPALANVMRSWLYEDKAKPVRS